MSLFTILLGIFTVILFLYLWLVSRSIVIPTKINQNRYWFYPVLAACVGLIGWTGVSTLDEKIQTGLAVLVMLSFLMDKRGLTETHIVLHSFDNRGISFSEIERVVLFKDDATQSVRMNFFRNERRGPMLIFDESLEELAIFFSTHLNEGSKLEILTKED
ncbi:hypothetical protein NRIC_15090 [Enterococcus florum]|uniref:DUF5673 domain-containing protein n=1 Tax=Enterococcus florum TaxID=2480627 RepID=A0A4P5PCD1_9ENTE|nr:hypothetical protein [Enterococcus florum]GCF93618.1 hypothetical protein NRIC_15090 [Enterococcus florum]